jgi:hypothetical protein
MASFESVLPALMNGKRIRRNEWGCGSHMYENEHGELMRTPTQYPTLCDDTSCHRTADDYGWMLNLDDLTAKDWHIAMPLSGLDRHRQFPNPSSTHRELTSSDAKLALSKPQRVLRYVERFASVFHQFFRRNRAAAE